MTDGLIFDLKRGSFHDGPGIRTVVFLKGCPLDCIWCHNPESKKYCPELMYDDEKCIHCGLCIDPCIYDAQRLIDDHHEMVWANCRNCMNCTNVCPVNALQIVGYTISAAEIILEACEDKTVYDISGGGLTISGGEPLAQIEFTAEILTKAKQKGLHTCLDTSGYASIDTLDMVIDNTDIFLFDIKETDSERHRQCTGVALELILSNLEYLNSKDKQIILRCPIIPGINDRSDHREKIYQLARTYSCITKVDFLEYHNLGNDKLRCLASSSIKINIPSVPVFRWLP